MRSVLLVAHIGRPEAIAAGRKVVTALLEAGLSVRTLAAEREALAIDELALVPADASAAQGCELAVVLGGDGTLAARGGAGPGQPHPAAGGQPRARRVPRRGREGGALRRSSSGSPPVTTTSRSG